MPAQAKKTSDRVRSLGVFIQSLDKTTSTRHFGGRLCHVYPLILRIGSFPPSLAAEAAQQTELNWERLHLRHTRLL